MCRQTTADFMKLLDEFGQSIQEDDLFRILGRVQDRFGGIPKDVVVELAERSGCPVARLYGVVTGYPGFKVMEA